jgi:hypothetical protein
MRLIRDQWVEIGERPRHSAPLMWLTYDSSPITMGEATELAMQNRLILMHRHEADRVVALIYSPSVSKHKRKK